MYRHVLPLLGTRWHAIAIDTPGFGASDPLPELPTIPAYASALAETLDALDLDVVHLVGFHTGASIALQLALSSPERVDRIVLAGLLALIDDTERDFWRERILRPWQPDGHGGFVEEILWWLPFYVAKHDGSAALHEVIARLQAGPDYLQAPQAVIAHDALASVARLNRPVLFLSPVGDNLRDTTRRAHASLPGSAYVEVPGNDGAVWDYPAEFASAVGDFMAS
jgi:pimeloyl-ACP methyl ester carboxylesterase